MSQSSGVTAPRTHKNRERTLIRGLYCRRATVNRLPSQSYAPAMVVPPAPAPLASAIPTIGSPGGIDTCVHPDNPGRATGCVLVRAVWLSRSKYAAAVRGSKEKATNRIITRAAPNLVELWLWETEMGRSAGSCRKYNPTEINT